MPLLAPGKPLALLTYLALAPGRAASREALLDLLWADMDGDRGRHALRQTLWQLRQLLGESALEGREEIRLSLPLHTDRDTFLAAIERGDLASAIGAYSGHFLPGFAAPGGAEFEQWADRERDRLRGLFVRAADTLARRALASGRPREAVHLARRIRGAEPLQEGGWRLLLEALRAAGDRVQLLVEADALEELLRVEDREPEPQTRAALRAARQVPHQSAASPDARLVAELVGREVEFRTLTQAWESARTGPAAAIRLVAAAGLGKTRLLLDFHARLRTLGARTVLGRANPGERALPGSLIADLAAALAELPGANAVAPATAGTLVAMNPALSSRFTVSQAQVPRDEDLTLQRVMALADLVNAIAFEGALAILVDDLHWADDESLRILAGMQARISAARVLLVSATRPNRGLQAAGADTRVVPIEPLPLAAVEALVTSIARPPIGPEGELLVTTLWRASGGSPLQVLEALQQALDEGCLELAEAEWRVRDPELLAVTLAHGGSRAARLGSLDPSTRYILTLLGVAGTPCSTALLARAASREGAGIGAALATLERRGFITDVGGEWVPAHDEFAEAAVDLADPASLKAAARGLAEALLSQGRVDDETLHRAVQLYVDAEADDRIAPVLVAQRPGSWSGQEMVAQRAAVADITGLELGDPRLAPILQALPRRRRWPATLAAAAVLVLAAAAWFGPTHWGVPSSTPDAMIAILDLTSPAWEDRVGTVRMVPIDAGGWQRGEPLLVPDRGGPFPDLPPTSQFGLLHDGSVIYTRFVDNRNTDDIFISRPGAPPALLTGGPRDDGLPSLSPSSQEIAFNTARWSPEGADDYDLGVLSLQDGSVRQLTHGPDFDGRAAWSPTGTVIAFPRTPRELRPPEICWITTEPGTSAVTCRPAPGAQAAHVLAFTDHETVIFKATSGQRTAFFRWHLVDDRIEEFWSMAIVAWIEASPDGRWILCRCARSVAADLEWQVFPVANPADARTFSADPNAAVGWRSPLASSLTRLELPRLGPLATGTSRVLRVSVQDQANSPVWLPRGAISYHVADTSIATIDPSGRLIRAVREGETMLHVRAGLLQPDSARIVVTAGGAELILQESWATLDSAGWTPFGVPRPRLARHADGTRGFNNGGDGSYASGVFSAGAWSAEEGLGVEARVSSVLTRSQWQMMHIFFESARQTPVELWDRVTGAPRSRSSGLTEACNFNFPNGEGYTATRSFAFWPGGGQHREFEADSTWRSGSWHIVRIQLFPDGSCGLAVDGVALARSAPLLPSHIAYRLWLSGNSADTDQLLIGPLTVWRGVKTDIDWGALDPLP